MKCFSITKMYKKADNKSKFKEKAIDMLFQLQQVNEIDIKINFIRDELSY